MPSVPLETFGGLTTSMRPEDLPEGASPRNNDVDFLPGCFLQRPGLQSVYSFSGASVGPSAGTAAVNVELGQTNWSNPGNILLNDGSYASVALSTSGSPTGAFTAAASSGAGAVWANPTNVNGSSSYAVASFAGTSTVYHPTSQIIKASAYAYGAHPSVTTISPSASGFSPVSALGGSVSLSVTLLGTFPDVPSNGQVRVDYSINSGSTWTTAQSWLGDFSGSFSYAIAGLSNLSTLQVRVVAIANFSGFGGDTSALTSVSTSAISVTLITGGASTAQSLYASVSNFSIPSNATITGFKVSFQAQYATTAPSFHFQLTNGSYTATIGTQQSATLTSSPATYTYGGSGNLWGYGAWTPALFSTLGLVFSASVSSGTGTVSVNSLVLTVYYTLTSVSSDGLQVTEFGFNLPSSDGILGFAVALKGFAASTSRVSCQLIKNGAPVGVTRTKTLPTTLNTITYGGSNDLFGTTWTYADANNTNFGVRFVCTSGSGTVNLDYCTVTIYFVTSPQNFNWCGTFQDDAGTIKNFALDNNGEIWLEDATNNPGVLTASTSLVPPGSYAGGYSAYNRMYVTPSILTQGTGIPLQYAPGGWWDKVTQTGPAQAPIVAASQSAGAIATISNIAITSNVVTLTTSTQAYTAGEVVTLSGLTTVTALNGLAFSILGTGLTTTQIEIAFVHADVGSTPETGTITPQYSYPIVASPTGITQNPAQSDPDAPGHLQCVLWSSGPGSKSPGNVITIYYVNAFSHPTGQDQTLVDAFNSGQPVYVYVKDAPWGNGTWLVTSIGMDVPPGAEYGRYYFTYQVPGNNYQQTGAPDSATGTYQLTVATINTTVPVPGLAPGDQIALAGVTAAAWDGVYTVTQALNSGSFVINQTALAGGIATYTWALVNGDAPAAGQLVTVTGTLNANGLLNVTEAVIATATGVGSGTFTIANFPTGLTYATVVESGLATTAGTKFTFDPGQATAGNPADNPIFGNSGGGTLTVVGASTGGTFPIGAGTRQCVMSFITRNGLTTAPSPPVTFTVATGSNYISLSNCALGPPNVIARLFSFTEAGQNGVAGANFYTQRVPTVFTVGNTQYTSSALLIPDNTTTNVKFTFSDFVLLNGESTDTQGNDLFNLLEIGAPAWTLQYGSRMVYGLVQNKVPNFLNLSFDGGYLPSTGAVPNVPLGWVIDPNYQFAFGPSNSITAFQITSNIVTFTVANTFAVGQTVAVSGLAVGTYLNDQLYTVLTASSTQFTAAFVHADVGLTADAGTAKTEGQAIQLLSSPIFGNSLYIKNTTSVTQATLGMLTQRADLDAYNVGILQPNQPYSVRVTCRAPSGLTTGNLVIDLVGSNGGVYGTSYGSYTIPFASMKSFMQTFTGTLLTGNGLNPIPSGLLLRVYCTNVAYRADVEIDRVEPFPTRQPVLPGPLLSYIQKPEQVDGVSGPINTNAQNPQPCFGGAVIYDQLYLLKERSMLTTQDAPNLEPTDWTIHQVSATVGTCGPNAFAYGDEWLLTACRSGIYGFIGRAPEPVSRELQGGASGSSLWEAINWNAGHTIWLRNDLVNRRFYVGIPLPTPNFWLPNAPVNAAPTSPNVVLMCNYEGCPTFEELISASPVHTTMFGDVKAVDMRRKWSIWQIQSPYADFIRQSDGLTFSLLFCNGVQSGKIYQLANGQLTDDGSAINWSYTTYPFIQEKQGQQLGLGAARKLWDYFVCNASISGAVNVVLYPNTLQATYPFTIPLKLTGTGISQNDFERRLEIGAQRMFIELSSVGSGGYSEVTSITLDGKAHPWTPRRGTAQ